MPSNGYGESETYDVINLLTFADNFTLFASSYEQLQMMINELTARVQEVGPTWKIRKNREGKGDWTGCDGRRDFVGDRTGETDHHNH